jgi:hypothetical protein
MGLGDRDRAGRAGEQGLGCSGGPAPALADAIGGPGLGPMPAAPRIGDAVQPAGTRHASARPGTPAHHDLLRLADQSLPYGRAIGRWRRRASPERGRGGTGHTKNCARCHRYEQNKRRLHSQPVSQQPMPRPFIIRTSCGNNVGPTRLIEAINNDKRVSRRSVTAILARFGDQLIFLRHPPRIRMTSVVVVTVSPSGRRAQMSVRPGAPAASTVQRAVTAADHCHRDARALHGCSDLHNRRSTLLQPCVALWDVGGLR